MMDLFEDKNLHPMLIGEEADAFDSKDFIYELKLDGERGVAYLDKSGTEMRNKRNRKMLQPFPELSELHKQIKKRCILDGEYVVVKNGRPDFYEVNRRSIMTNPFKIQQAAAKLPVVFVAFDILYLKDSPLLDVPLLERKKLLEQNVTEGGQLVLSRYIEEKGIDFYRLAEQQKLEGIVAKRKDSGYFPGKRTKNWIKSKYMQDDDFVVCGFIPKAGGMTSLVLGQYQGSELIYKGHVTLGVSGSSFRRIAPHSKIEKPSFAPPKGNENVTWIVPDLVCTVKYMMKSEAGSMRQPVFKGLREDKVAGECICE